MCGVEALKWPCLPLLAVLLLSAPLRHSRVHGVPLFGDLKVSDETTKKDSATSQEKGAGAEFDYYKKNFFLEEASHKCLGKGYHQRICTFHDLLLWNDTFYYVTTEESILEAGLPEIPMSWVHIPFAEKMRFSEGGMARMVRPQDLPFVWEDVPKLEMQEAIIWHLTYHDNFGHLLGEHGPTLHNALCTYLGRCTFSAEDRDVHILLPHNEDDMMAVVPSAANQMFQCFTRHPMRQTDELIFQNRVVIVRRALAGIGPTCRGFPWCRLNYGRDRLPAHSVVSWRSRLMQCLGLPSNLTINPAAPRIVIINRPFAVGRGFLNIDDVVQTLQSHFPNATLEVHLLDGKMLAEQAAVYINASIVIQMHGAALGNMIFLPRGASIIDVVPQNHEDKHAWAFFMASDFQALKFNPISIPAQRPVPMLHKVKAYPQWLQLTDEWRDRIINEGICPRDDQIDNQFSSNIFCKFYWILKHANVVLNSRDISMAVESAMQHIRGLAENPVQLDTKLSSRYTVF